MTAFEVADLLAVPKTRVRSMSRRGEIPTVRLGLREVRYRRQDIDAWIARRTTSRPRGTSIVNDGTFLIRPPLHSIR